MRPPAELPSVWPIAHREAPAVMRIAHRGGGAQERYFPSDLLEVAEQGAQFVEVDLHVTADHHLVARHDPVVETVRGRRWLFDHSLSDLGTLPSPTAEDVIKGAARAGLGLYLDIKSLTVPALERLVGLLEAHAMDTATVFASVRSDIVARCAKTAPRIPRSILFASVLEDPVQLALSIDANFVHPCWERQHPQPHLLLEGAWLERVRSHRLGVVTWHEERPDVLRSLLDLGVDGICTDTPPLLADLAA